MRVAPPWTKLDPILLTRPQPYFDGESGTPTYQLVLRYVPAFSSDDETLRCPVMNWPPDWLLFIGPEECPDGSSPLFAVLLRVRDDILSLMMYQSPYRGASSTPGAPSYGVGCP